MRIKLREILDKKGITVYALSKKTGISQNNLSKLIKQETSSIRFDTLEIICQNLNITPNDILEVE